MAGTPIKRARRVAGVRAGLTPGTASVYADGTVYTGKVFDAEGDEVLPEDEGRTVDYPRPHQSSAPARVADHRARLMAVADDCLAKLAVRPDRDVSCVYKDAMYLLMKLEAQDKDPTPRPEDVRKGVVDMLTMLPDLCANDAGLRALAVEALAAVVAQSEAEG